MMKAISHFIGGVLLVIGTTIGAGIVALPVQTSIIGFFPSLAIFLVCWVLMLLTAFFFLDVNLATPGESNLVSMAGKTLGLFGKIISWGAYLLLLYSLTAAYIAGSAPLFCNAFAFLTGMELPLQVSFFILPLVFGVIIYFGTGGVDLANRIMMIGLAITYVVLLFVLPQKFDPSRLQAFSFDSVSLVVPVIIVSFGYHIVIPSLTTYMSHDKKKLRLVLLIGSIVPLISYVLWEMLILGVIPLDGANGLRALLREGKPVTESLATLLRLPWIGVVGSCFSFFVIVTSFLGVTLSLSDFLIDGCHIKKTWKGKLLAIILTFVPPLLFVFTYQKGFYLALRYGGVFVVVLLILLPALMAWNLQEVPFYQTRKGRLLLLSVMIFSLCLLFFSLQRGWIRGG